MLTRLKIYIEQQDDGAQWAVEQIRKELFPHCGESAELDPDPDEPYIFVSLDVPEGEPPEMYLQYRLICSRYCPAMEHIQVLELTP